MTDVDEFMKDTFAHFGVKGMRWGVRRSKSPVAAGVVDLPGGKIATYGGKNQPASDDAKKAAVSKRIVDQSGTKSLSNRELQELVTRMNLEQQYSNLASKQPTTMSKGQGFIKSVLNSGKTINEVVAFSNSPAGQAIRDQLANK